MIRFINKLRNKFTLGNGSSALLNGEILTGYNKSREIKNPGYICHAPFSNMYFNSVGDVAMCWLTFDDPDKYTADKTIKDIWFGEKFSKVRRSIKNLDLDYRCKVCKKHLVEGNFVNVLARAYDNDFPLSDYPTVMEFELSNTCNLECTMCNGLLSSSIRKNREKLPALKSPYGDKFVEELTEFIPHLYEARFNGGEPFLIPIYYKIWDLILEMKPDMKMVIATNGTVLNKRVKSYLERGNYHLNISIDALDPENYRNIRVNSNIDRVIENFEYFKEYCLRGNRNLCVMINPMRQNWWEMSDFVNFCNEHNVHLWFNTIIRPYDQALWPLSGDKLKEVYDTLANAKINPNKNASEGIYKYNLNTYKNLVHTQVKNWMHEAYQRERNMAEKEKALPKNLKKAFYERLDAYLEHNPTNHIQITHQRGLLLEKVKDVRIKADFVTEQQFYEILSNTPIDLVIDNLENKSVDDLLEQLKENSSRSY